MENDFIPQLSTIRVENLRLRAYIGFIDWEKEKLQDIVVSYSFKYNTKTAAASDNVEDAVDYKVITKGIIKMVNNNSFHLIEYLADKIYNFILTSTPAIQNIEVKVEKPHALRFSDNVLVEIKAKDRYNTAMIALGSNIDAASNFEKALDYLQQTGKIVKRTAFITTQPLKFSDQPDFLNGAVLLLTRKSLSELVLELKQIETLLDRVRTENKNAPRTIDLDVTTYNNFLIDKEIKELPFLVDFVKNLQPDVRLDV